MRLALFPILLALFVAAAPPTAGQGPTPVNGQPAIASPDDTAERIAEVRQYATEANADQLAEEVRKQIIETCDRAAETLTKVQETTKRTAALKDEVEKATSGAAPAPETPADDEAELDELSLEKLQGELSAADQRVSAARDQLEQARNEIEHRAAIRLALPEALLKVRQRLTKAEEAVRGDYSADHPALADAKRLGAQARVLLARRELLLLEQQNRTFEATARWWSEKQDALAKRLRAAEQRLAAVSAEVAEQQQIEADRKAREAAMAEEFAHPAVKAEAAINADLAKTNATLVQERDTIRQQLEQAKAVSESADNNLQRVMDEAEELRDSPTIGAVLRSEREQLPDLTAIRQQQRARQDEISDLRVKRYEWKARRDQLSPIDQALAAAVERHRDASYEEASEEITSELRRVLESRREILGMLADNASESLSDLGKIDAAQALTVQKTEALSDFIAERVLWVPSAERLSAKDLSYTRDFWLDLRSRIADVRALGSPLLADVGRHPELYLVASMTTLLLVAWRNRAKKVLYKAGDLASKPSATSFRPTVEALFETFFLAAPTPLVLGFFGWRLSTSTDSQAYAFGGALTLFAMQYFVLDLLRHACRTGGLGPAHFGWDRKGMVSLRRAARPMQLVAMPLLAIAIGVEITRDEAAIGALGRLSLILSLLVMGAIGFLFFRPSGPLINALAASGEKLWIARGVRLLGPLAVVAAVGLAIASGLGMHYTALQLTRRILFTIGVVIACLAVRALLMRWLLIAYRRVAMQRAREKRQALLEAQEQTPQESAPIEVEPEVSLSDINQQARSLVGVGVTVSIVGSLLWVWGDVLPALNVLQDFSLWTSGIADSDGAYPKISLAEALGSAAVFVLTWFAGRNVPGLLEIVLFQKLPLDAGARYAATSVSRYVIVVLGVGAGMRLIGIGWESVQWLVAAMTVGLGFGLQEIFANFVSGIILLFERPVRPGDVVTIGDVSGVVTRIRIRATTVQDWDNKELIVPNREFITGNLINWTLSSRVLRHVLKVGVAYGSDTRLATELLYKVARENEHVAETPEPFVLFDSFGDSTLNFELRVFTTDLAHMMPMRNQLMFAVDDVFREHGVEIAFPQQDLHLRSVPPGFEGRSAEDQMLAPRTPGAEPPPAG